jgi:hypothetical protein
MENGYVESFNGSLRDECLTENWFGDLAEARETIEAWRQDYNQFRLQSALGYRTPEEFAKSAARRLWKRRRKSRLGKCFAFPLSHGLDGCEHQPMSAMLETQTPEKVSLSLN